MASAFRPKTPYVVKRIDSDFFEDEVGSDVAAESAVKCLTERCRQADFTGDDLKC